jgi:Spy/CpxP family protein refolding chaperone
MKSYTKLFAPIGLAILLGSLTFIFAQKSETDTRPPHGKEFGRMPPPNGMNPRLLDQLSLSDEQKQKIHTLEQSSQTDAQTYFEKLRVIDEKIKDTIETESFDEAQARQLLKAKSEIQIELEINRLKKDSAIFNILSAEQIAKLELLKQQRPEFPPNGFRPDMPPQN